jgi:hypothetical protein
MGNLKIPGIKIYRNIYIKGYKKFPYQKLTGRNILLYRGKIICGIDNIPDDFNNKLDLFISCDCDFSKWKNLQRIL